MAVDATVALPAQPTVGSTNLIPLGGDGWVAPHSVYSVDQQVVHDASGGIANNQVRFDPRYTQLVSYMLAEQTSGAATVLMTYTIQCDAQDRIAVTVPLLLQAQSGLSVTNRGLWTPPAMLCSAGLGADDDPPFVSLITDNTDTETTVLRVRIYNFDKRARERVPLPQLLASLYRGSNVT